MPLFDFRCAKCDLEFEVLVIGGRLPSCPACKSPDLVKLMSSFSVRGGGTQSVSASSSGGSKCAGCAGGSCGTCR